MSAMPGDESRYLRRIQRTLTGVTVGTVLILAGWVLRDILLLIFMSVLIACILRGASDCLHRWTGVGEGWALFTVVASIFSTLALLTWWRGPVIADQATQVFDQLVTQVQRLWQQLAETPWGGSIAGRLRQAVEPGSGRLAGHVTGVVSSTFGVGGSTLLVIATALFLAISPQIYVAGTVRLLPPLFRRVAEKSCAASGRPCNSGSSASWWTWSSSPSCPERGCTRWGCRLRRRWR